jgi:hypothetical protein
LNWREEHFASRKPVSVRLAGRTNGKKSASESASDWLMNELLVRSLLVFGV